MLNVFSKENRFKKKNLIAPIWIFSILIHSVMITALTAFIFIDQKKTPEQIFYMQQVGPIDNVIIEDKEIAVIKEIAKVDFESVVMPTASISTEIHSNLTEIANHNLSQTAEDTNELINDAPQLGSGSMGNLGGDTGGEIGGAFMQRTNCRKIRWFEQE